MRVLIAGDRPADRDALRQAALGVGLECGAGDAVPLVEAHVRAAAPGGPQLVLVDVGTAPDLGTAAVTDLARVGAAVFAVGPVADGTLLHRALSAGARGYLNRADLKAELARTLDGLRAAGTARVRRGAVAAVTAAHPGAGVTTTAAGLAFALAADGAGSVCLAELAPPVPDLALALDLKPAHSVAELLAAPDRLDVSMVRAAAVRHPAGVDVLAYPPEATAEPLEPGPGAAVQLVLRAGFDWTVQDLGFGVGPGPAELLRQADVVVVVVHPDVPGVRLARRHGQRLADAGVRPDRVRVVVNRYGQAGQLGWQKVQEALAAEVAVWLPDDPAGMNAARNLGKPATEAAGRRTARRLRDLARAARAATPVPPQPSERR